MIRKLEWSAQPWRQVVDPKPWSGPNPIWVMQALWVLAEYRYVNTFQLATLAWPDVQERQARNRLQKLWDAGWVQYTGVLSQALRGQGRYPRVWSLTQAGDAQVRGWSRAWDPDQTWPDWEAPLPLHAAHRLLHELELVDLTGALTHVWRESVRDPWVGDPVIYGTRRAWRRFPAPGGAVILAPDLLVLDRMFARRPVLVEYERYNDRDKYWGKLQRLSRVLTHHVYRAHFPEPPLMLTVIWREAGPTRPHGDRSRHNGMGLSTLAQRSGIAPSHLAFCFADDLGDHPASTPLFGPDGVQLDVPLAHLGLPL